VILADQVLKVFQKVHVLPYQDTFKYNYDFMYHEHLVPYFQTAQVGEFTEGFDFAQNGVRFSVISVEPKDSYGVVGQATDIFYEGPAIERKVLDRLQLVPFELGLPEKYRPTRLSLDEAALLRDYVRPYFQQRSAPVSMGQAIHIQGVKFKVVACRPSEGGGVGKDTELACQGVALKGAGDFRSPAPKARPGSAPKSKAASRPPAAAGSEGSRAWNVGQSRKRVVMSRCVLDADLHGNPVRAATNGKCLPKKEKNWLRRTEPSETTGVCSPHGVEVESVLLFLLARLVELDRVWGPVIHELVESKVHFMAPGFPDHLACRRAARSYNVSLESRPLRTNVRPPRKAGTLTRQRGRTRTWCK
ncbi:unnamed protein product, partial [Polarella glacialis]